MQVDVQNYYKEKLDDMLIHFPENNINEMFHDDLVLRKPALITISPGMIELWDILFENALNHKSVELYLDVLYNIVDHSPEIWKDLTRDYFNRVNRIKLYNQE